MSALALPAPLPAPDWGGGAPQVGAQAWGVGCGAALCRAEWVGTRTGRWRRGLALDSSQDPAFDACLTATSRLLAAGDANPTRTPSPEGRV